MIGPVRPSTPSGRSLFERIYTLVVLVKGLDGTVELLAGLVLLVAPDAAADAVAVAASELAEGGSVLQRSLAHSVAKAGGGLTGGNVALAVFLLVHGVVKLLTVTALLRRAVHWYPWAIGALGVLLVAQVIDLVAKPGVGGVVLAVLDVVVIVLVVWEYRRLRADVRSGVPARSATG